MTRKKAEDFDPQLLELFDGYVHGALNKREFLSKASAFAVGGMGAATLLQALQPDYALAKQVAPDDPALTKAIELAL